jgi:SPP1 family predicted phage head-tail adaptor
MASRTAVRTPKRKICAGDLNAYIFLKNRSIAPAGYDADTGLIDVGFTENFGDEKNDACWAGIKTVTGKQIFNGVGTDLTTITHEIITYYDSEVTSETWVQDIDGRLYDIVKVEDFDERHQYMRLWCVERGLGEAAKA